MKNFRFYIKLLIINGTLIILLIEIFSYFFIINNSDVTTRPVFINQPREHYGDYNEIFGAWHIKNSKFRHKKSCFDVDYSFNSFGARDTYRDKDIVSTIVLGDSIVEGYGVDDNYRFSNLLEKRTKIPHLNFGTSGHFGSTQVELLYSKFASKFKHNKIIYIITVTNDFEDDSYEYGKRIFKKRYRPYRIKKSDENFILRYFDTKYLKKEKRSVNFRDILMNYTSTYHVLRYLYSVSLTKRINSVKSNKKIKDYYNQYTEEELDILLYNLKKIAKYSKINNSKLYVFLFPSMKEYYQNINVTNQSKLYLDLKKHAVENNYFVNDLLQNAKNLDKENFKRLFFNCDNHPNKLGHNFIYKHIYDEVYGKK